MTRILPLLAWLLLMSAGIAVLRSTPVTHDITQFLPTGATPQQQLAASLVRSGPASRLILIGLENASPAELAQTSRRMAGILQASGLFSQVNNGMQIDRDRLELNSAIATCSIRTPPRHPLTSSSCIMPCSNDSASSPAHFRSWTGSNWQPTRQPHFVRYSATGSHSGSRRYCMASGSRRTNARHCCCDHPRTRFRFSRTTAGSQHHPRGIHRSGSCTGHPVAAHRLTGFRRQCPQHHPFQPADTVDRGGHPRQFLSAVRLPVDLPAHPGWFADSDGAARRQSGDRDPVRQYTWHYPGIRNHAAGRRYRLPDSPVQSPGTRQNPAAVHSTPRPTLRLGVITTCIGDFAIARQDFTGLAQLGIFTTCGLLTAAFITRWLLPSLLVSARPPNVRGVLSTGLHPLLNLPRNITRLVLVAALVTLALLATFSPPEWETDVSALSPLSSTERRLDSSLRQAIGAPDVSQLIVVSGADAETVLLICEQAAGRLQRAAEQGLLTVL